MAEQEGFASGEDVDRLISLPDDVIFRILSYLTRHEAIKTTLLSRRWRSLFPWTAFLTLDCGSSGLSDQWVCYPPLHGVKVFEMPLSRHFQLNHLHSASFLFNCNTLVRLKLRFGQFFSLVVPDTVYLPKLKVLHLQQIKFADDESVRRLFSGCCVLEELVVKCWKLEHTRQFSVSSPTLETLILRSLICSYPNQELVINAPSIVYFEHLDIGPTSPTVDLRGISNIQPSYLSNRVMRAFGLYRNVRFPNFTYLNTNGCFYYDWNDILRSSSCLETLVIKLELPPSPGHRLLLPKMSSYKLSKLKAIEFLSFQGKQHEMQLVEDLLKNAPNLQNLTVHVSQMERLSPGVTKDLTKLARVSKKCNIIIVSDIIDFHHCPNLIGAPAKHKNPATSWCPPKAGEVKFNVDGSSLGKPRPAGIGGILRNQQGNVLMSFFKNIKVVDSNEAEILAIREALIIFVDSRWVRHFNLVIESDSASAVLWSNNPEKAPKRLRRYSNHIHNLKSKVPHLQIVHVLREGSTLADSLAKQGVNRVADFIHTADL